MFSLAPKPAAAPAANPQESSAPPANAPGRGNLLAGIQGFNKGKLKDTDTKDSSTPATSNKPAGGGGPGARPGGGPPMGGGPFGIPPGGVAGLKKTGGRMFFYCSM